MGSLPDDSTHVNGAGELGIEGVRHIVLSKLPCAPTRHVQELVVQAEVDVGDHRRHCAEALQQRRQQVRVGRLCRHFDDLGGCPLVAVLVPQEYRARQVFKAGHDSDEAIRLARVVRRSEFQRHLVLGS